MKDDRGKTKRIFLSIIAVLVFAGAFGISVFAQRPITTIERRTERLNRQSEQWERDRMNREMKGVNRKAVNSKQTLAIKAQIREDFEALQTTYNEIIINLQSGNPGRDFVLKATADVKKYAVRLKNNLALPKLEKDEVDDFQTELNPDNRREYLRTLCQHIYNFITNPIFNEPTGLDIEQAANAEREIDKVIELSEKIRETAEKSAN